MKRLLSAALLVASLTGCEPKEVNYSLNIVTKSCDSAADPFNGVQFLRIRVTGKDMEQQLIQFQKNLALMGTMLFLIANGPGAWSLDNKQ